MKKNASKRLLTSVFFGLLITPVVSFSEVVYLDKEIEVGNQLYTRAASDDCSKVKIWRKTVTEKKAQGINYTFALAIMKDSDKESTQVKFEEIGAQERGSNICKQGGCYTKEEEPVSEARHWLSTKCAHRNK